MTIISWFFFFVMEDIGKLYMSTAFPIAVTLIRLLVRVRIVHFFKKIFLLILHNCGRFPLATSQVLSKFRI